MIYLVFYGLVASLLALGIVLSIRDVNQLTTSMNGKFAESVQPTEDEHDC